MKTLLLSTLLALSTTLLSTTAQAADSVIERDLQQRISKAQSALSQTETSIGRERGALAKELGRLERDVNQLEEQTAAARRQADEKNLSLSKLQERLQSWTDQHNYQSNLLQQFLRQQGTGAAATPLNDQLASIQAMAAASEAWLEPAFADAQLVLDNGSIAPAQRLSLGPVHWMLSGEQAFRADQQDGEWRVQHTLGGRDLAALTSLQQGQAAALSFDPSLSLLDQVPAESVGEHLQKGGIWVVPILLFALLALTIAALKGAQLLRLPKVVSYTPAVLAGLMNKGGDSVLKNGSMQQRLLTLAQQSPSARERDDQLFLQLQQDRITLERRLTAIAITASVSPLLGLLGTVSGMIETFRMMTLFGSGNPEVVSGGIAQALITTELGLVVAIPALVIHSLLSRRARSYYLELENFAILLSKADEYDSAPATKTTIREEAIA
ncbi:MotA/TolQ/ExbB proton channel family protein [Thalassolituus sp. LLYu03]|uniref:MotA/TolQ/ExbB proton channel family protein n=1 Tax=Thalassolituus sp. LLYu03 TaxID=3421656 RepID=UPI003D2E8FAF